MEVESFFGRSMATDPSMTTDPSITLSPSRTTNRTLALHQARAARQRRLRIAGAAVGLVLVAGVGAIALLDPLDRDDRPMPSDEQVRQLWSARRADFEALRSMIDADRTLTVVGEDRVDGCAREAKDLSWGCPGAPGLELGAMLQTVHLAADRYALYRKHLAAVGGDRAARRDSGVTVGLYRAGHATSGVGKNVVWAPAPPAPVVADTDRDRPSGRIVSYAALSDGWYIEHSSE
jgi:hypothetical protein